MKKRILSFLLALCMCLTLVPVTVLADDDVQQINDAAVQTITPGSDVSVQSVVPDTGAYRTYKFYSGETLLSEQIVKNGDTLYEPPVTAPEGKTFTGWNPKVDFGTVSGITETETITVNAQFEDGYHVYFKDNNDRIIATKTGKTNQTISVDDVNFPVNSDQAITGWYTDKSYADGTKVTSVTIGTTDITLYAKVEEGYWLTFESNGGSYVAPAFYAKGTPAAAPDEPTKSGYTFAGWYTDEALTKEANFSTITTATTLYAKWTASQQTQYTVIHWLENADDDGYSYKESETKNGTTGTQTNATAKSYNYFTAQAITQQDIKGDGSTIVNVYYKRKVYTLTFRTSSDDGRPFSYTTVATISAKHGAKISDEFNKAPFNTTYKGRAWKCTESSKYNYALQTLDRMPHFDATFNLYNKSSKVEKTIYYYVQKVGTTVSSNQWPSSTTNFELFKEVSTYFNYATYNEEYHEIDGFTRYSSQVAGFRNNQKNFTHNNELYLYYLRNSYNIIFMNNGAQEKADTYEYGADISGASYTPTTVPAGKEGYLFAGWYDNEDGNGTAYVFDGKTMPANNITLYAKWVAPTYTVTVYDVNGETVLGTFTEVAKNSTISIDEMPAPTLAEGETFLGWVQEDGTPFSFSTKINRNYDLYAKVGNSSRYTVTYHSNTTPDTTVTDNEMIYAKDVLATVNDNTFTNDGKVFLSWNTEAGGTGTTYYPNGTIKVTGNMDLYAQWGDKASTVQLTYKANGGTGDDITDAKIPNNDRVTLRSADTFTRTGYHFTGWNTKADGTGTKFNADASARVDNLGSGNVLYAQWEANTNTAYKVEFYYQNDEGSYPTTANETKERTGTTDAAVSVTLADKADKVNGKYVYDANNTNNKESGTVKADGSLVLKLYFKLNQFDVTVNYYWNGTTEPVKPSKTINAQTVGTSVTESPAAIDGYTAVDKEAKSITIGTGKNEITFYYYKNVELTAVSDEVTYDGNEHSVSGFTGAPEGADFSAITVGATGTVVGTYPANFDEDTVGTVDATAKYIVTKANNGKLTITPVTDKVTVTINGHKDTKTYDGTEYTVEGYDVVRISNDLYSADNVTLKAGVTAEATGTNVKAGGYLMGLTEGSFQNTNTNFTNVEFVVEEDGKLTINPRNVTLTSEGGEKPYDGTPLTKPNVTVTGDGFVEGEVTDIKATGSVTYVSEGEVTNTITYTTGEKFNAGNYDISKSEGKLKITDRAEKYEITVKANSGEKTYDGTALTVEGFETLTFVVNGETYTVSGLTASKTGTNVSDSGVVEVTGTAVVKDAKDNDVTSQFNVNTEDGKLTINPRKVTLTSASDSKEYDGTPLTNKTVNVTGDGFVDGEGATYDVTGTITNVAENEANNNTFTYTLNDNTKAENYVIETALGTLEITPVAAEVTVTIKGHTTDDIYDATEKTAEGYDVISISNDLYAKGDFVLTGKDKVTGTAAGEYNMGLAFKNISENFSKVTFVVEDGKLTIAKRDVTVTGESATKVYNGQTQEINGYTVDNLVDGHKMTGVTYSAKGKDPGTHNGSFTGNTIVIKDADGKDVTKNYNIKTVIGALTITQPSQPSHPTRPSTPTKDVTSVKTADGSQMALWMSMMLASAAGIVFLGKKRKEEQ